MTTPKNTDPRALRAFNAIAAHMMSQLQDDDDAAHDALDECLSIIAAEYAPVLAALEQAREALLDALDSGAFALTRHVGPARAALAAIDALEGE